jgi:hypothetical protein
MSVAGKLVDNPSNGEDWFPTRIAPDLWRDPHRNYNLS